MRDVGAAAERGRWAIRCTAMCSVLVFAGYAVTGFGAVRRAGSLEACGFKQAFWSLLGLRPKVTRARGRGMTPAGGMEKACAGRRGRRPYKGLGESAPVSGGASMRAVGDAGPYEVHPSGCGAQKTPSVPMAQRVSFTCVRAVGQRWPLS